MAQLRIALAQINPTVGDIAGNSDLCLARCREAAARGAQLVALPEMAITGYPVEDLAMRPSFVLASRVAVSELAQRLADEGLGGLTVVVGFLDHDEERHDRFDRPGGAPQNGAAVLHDGEIKAVYDKHHLPNYGVFDEARYFAPGDAMQVVRVAGIDVAIAICEDLWQDGPSLTARSANADLLVVINGSPYERNKDDTRLELCSRRAVEGGSTLAYVNLVGGQDELVFDGDSLVVDADGRLLARAPQFEECLLVVDLELAAAGPDEPVVPAESAYPGQRIEGTVISAEPVARYEPERPPIAPPLDDCAEVWGALVTGLRDYVGKNGFPSVVFGLSGGIDSAVVATLSTDAIGADRVHAVSMPSSYSSEHSKDDARELARRTGIHFQVVPIAEMVTAFMDSLQLTGVAEENLQARCRGVVLMGLSNQHGHLVLAPGNKSEIAVGYSTIYGDAVGGFAPIMDVPKTLVWDLARWRNAEAERLGQTPPIPENSISKPPSAELRPGQVDTDSLPDYHILDDILDDYVERDSSYADLIAAGFDRETVGRVLGLVDKAEYKRRQYPPGPKISPRNFGRDRRLPITNAWRERASG